MGDGCVGDNETSKTGSPAKPPAIHAQMCKVMAEVGAVEKSRRNQQQGYAFRGIDDLYAAVQGVFAKHGVYPVPQVLEYTREERPSKSGGALIATVARIKHTFYAVADGSFVEAITLGEGMDSGDKSSNKSMSAAMKYALIECLCIPTWDPDHDSDAQSPEPTPKTTAPPPAVNGKSDPALAKRLRAAIEAAPNERELDNLAETVTASWNLRKISKDDLELLKVAGQLRRKQLANSAAKDVQPT